MNCLAKSLITFCVSFFFIGCSVVSEFYILNKRNEPVNIFLTFNASLKDSTFSQYLQPFISGKTHEALSDTIGYKVINDSTVLAVLPANAITLIGRLITPNIIKEVTFFTEGESQRISKEKLKKHTKVSKRLFEPYRFIYEID